MKLLFLLLPALLWGVPYWSDASLTMKEGEACPHHGPRAAPMFNLEGFSPEGEVFVRYLLPTLDAKEVELKGKMAMLPRTGMSNYHALTATGTMHGVAFTAVRYRYGMGRPSKTSPTVLTGASKGALEIQPDPLPREHDQYKGSKSFRFKVLFEGKPFSTDVEFVTSNGTEAVYRSDARGVVEVPFPNDFADVRTGRRSNRSADGVLTATHSEGNGHYAASLSMPYYVNPTDYWQSVPQGFLLIGAGLLLGVGGVFRIKRSRNG